ncbi:MAG: transcriptional repressor [Tissierellia bacterium]|nr:transcriptional repressor [Tissierellia bacterium]
MYRELFKKHNLKFSKPREAIYNLLYESKIALTADDISDLLRNDSSINLSTIYRTLNAFVECNLAEKTIMQNQIAYYEIVKEEHKHYFLCEVCDELTPLNECPIHDLENSLAKEFGFKINSHTLEFTGICKNCLEKQNENRK